MTKVNRGDRGRSQVCAKEDDSYRSDEEAKYKGDEKERQWDKKREVAKIDQGVRFLDKLLPYYKAPPS